MSPPPAEGAAHGLSMHQFPAFWKLEIQHKKQKHL